MLSPTLLLTWPGQTQHRHPPDTPVRLPLSSWQKVKSNLRAHSPRLLSLDMLCKFPIVPASLVVWWLLFSGFSHYLPGEEGEREGTWVAGSIRISLYWCCVPLPTPPWETKKMLSVTQKTSCQGHSVLPNAVSAV